MSEVGSAPRRLRRIGWIAGGTALGALALVGIFQGLTADLHPDEEDPDATFHSIGVERDLLRETVVASGSMEPLVRVPVIAEVSGIIAVVHVEEGQRVEKGQPLFELDRERLEARVAERQAELALRQANARYDLVGRAQVLLDQARREHRRRTDLHEREVASDLALERSKHELRLAQIGLRDAGAETAAREAAVAQARELLRQAERDLSNAIVRAPIDGVVIDREGEIGRAVADVSGYGGTVIAVIADDARIRLVGEVDESEIARVRVGQTAEVTIDAFPGVPFEGRVRKISSAGTSEGNVSNFEIDIELPLDERLRVGMSADARVIVREHSNALLVPNTAIVRRKQETLVRVQEVGGSSYRFVPIEPGYSDGFRTVVREGLQDDDVILVRDGGRG